MGARQINGEGNPNPGFIFDNDGTLARTDNLHYLSWQRALAAYGFIKKPEHLSQGGYHRLIAGLDGRNAMRNLFNELHEEFNPGIAELVIDTVRREYQGIVNSTEITGYSDGINLLVDAWQNNHPITFASSSTSARNVLSRLKLYEGQGSTAIRRAGITLETRAFDLMSAEGVYPPYSLKGKPNPDIYVAAAAQLGKSPEDCIAVEDTPSGVESAMGAGCFVVAVNRVGYNGQMSKLNPDRLYSGEIPQGAYKEIIMLYWNKRSPQVYNDDETGFEHLVPAIFGFSGGLNTDGHPSKLQLTERLAVR